MAIFRNLKDYEWLRKHDKSHNWVADHWDHCTEPNIFVRRGEFGTGDGEWHGEEYVCATCREVRRCTYHGERLVSTIEDNLMDMASCSLLPFSKYTSAQVATTGRGPDRLEPWMVK